MRHALRALLARPVFTLTAVLTLALGIGANTAIFSLIEQTLLHPFPFDTRGFVFVWLTNEQGNVLMGPNAATVNAWRQSARVLQSLETHADADVTLTGMGAAQVIPASRVTPGFIAALRLPVFGRGFTEADAAPGAAPVVVVSSAFAIRHFGARAEALGKTITLDGSDRTVIGVAPPALDGRHAWIGRWSVYIPTLPNDTVIAFAIGRLRPGVTPASATADLASSMPPTEKRSEGAYRPTLQRPQDLIGAAAGDILYVFAAAAGLVLLIGCANVANLLLARGIERRHEIALRSALGASRWRLVQQLLIESGLLATTGGALGIVLAWGVIQLLLAAWPTNADSLDLRSYLGPLSANPWVLAFSVALSLATGVLCGLMPAMRSTMHDLAGTLRAAGGGVTPGRRERSWLRDALVIGQVAMSVALLGAAGVLVRYMADVSREPLGYEPTGILAVKLAFSGDRYAKPANRAGLTTRVMDVIRRAPAVSAVATANSAPPSIFEAVFGTLQIDGRALRAEEQPGPASNVEADPAYFSVLRLSIVEGRPYDGHASSHEVVINASMARRYWPHESALGHRLRVSGAWPWLTIVGVAADVALPENGVLYKNQLYQASPSDGSFQDWLLIRTRGDPLAAIPVVRTAVASIDPLLPFAEITTVAALVRQSTVATRVQTILLLGFATVALILCGIGVYGVISFMVGRRTREIGVRLALGATRHDIRRLIAGHGGVLTVIGLAIGLPAALGLSKFAAHLASGINATDPLVFVVAASIVTVVAGLASLVPTRRATRVDPARTMREE